LPRSVGNEDGENRERGELEVTLKERRAGRSCFDARVRKERR